MIKNYFKTTFRNLWNNKTFSFINITDLAVGTLCCLYILLYIEQQYSYEKHHNNAADIYRINSTIKIPGDQNSNATASPPIAPALTKDFGEVQQFTRVVSAIGVKKHLLRYQEKSIYEKEVSFVDSTFFDVFTYHFVMFALAGMMALVITMITVCLQAIKAAIANPVQSLRTE